MEFRQTFTDISPTPVVAPTASRGPSQHFPWILKPDMMAPGHLVLGASLPNNTATQIVSGAAIYEAIVTAPEDYVVTVSPATLVFGKKYEIQSYNITLMGIGSENRKISFGELVWSEKSGNHKVRSPIVLFHLGLL
ncbi:subtilase family protein [Fagus crenata]